MIIEIESLNDERVQMFSTLTEAQLRNRLEPEKGIFIAESPKVIRVAMQAGYEPVAMLCEQRHIEGDAHDIIERAGEAMPVYTGRRELLSSLTGYTLTRGVLCAMRRPAERLIEEVTRGARRVVVIDGVVDTTNIGAIFRSAAALGIDAVLLTRNSCDPLNRRAVRVSMGSVFLVPWTWIGSREAEAHSQAGNAKAEVKGNAEAGAEGNAEADVAVAGKDYQEQLRQLGFATAAMALSDNSIALDAPILKQQERLAIIMGTEGDGLPEATIAAADFVVRIPMAHGVDSLNVAAASAVAFWELAHPHPSRREGLF